MKRNKCIIIKNWVFIYLFIYIYISAILLPTSRWRNGICVYLDTASSHFSNTQFASFSVILWAKFQIKSPKMKNKTRSKHLVKIPSQKKMNYRSILGLGLRVTCSLAGFFMRGHTVTTNWWHRLCTTQVHTNTHKHTQLIVNYITINLNTHNNH